MDVEAFEHAWRAGVHLERAGQLAAAIPFYTQAEALYLGDFLEQDQPEEWTLVRREHLKDTYLTILDKLSRHSWQTGHIEAAIEGWRKLLAKDPWREDAYRHLMACLAATGNRGLSLRWYGVCVQVLKDQLGIEPEPETMELFARIRAGSDISRWLAA
jgi:DNA-binding SARP family transcriptional activator